MRHRLGNELHVISTHRFNLLFISYIKHECYERQLGGLVTALPLSYAVRNI